uniref:Uncharacterized protein n=1 Tax=Anopheles coluzzii TaxID=1518534 RepID=A0A6E8V8U4_ANOCL|nr:uncharacterized protein LOC120958008 [Anopheles coluzzii]
MNSSLTIFAVLAIGLAVAQQPDESNALGAGNMATVGGVSLEQRTVDQQNQRLALSFARAFPEETPAEFQPLVVALYVRCQAELDNCADFLWETHLLREYRNCAMTQRRLCTQEVQELQAQLSVMADEANEQLELSPAEEEVLAQLAE